MIILREEFPLTATTITEETRTEGFVGVGSGRIWFESVETGPRTFLLLHGGPDAPSDELVPLLAMAALSGVGADHGRLAH